MISPTPSSATTSSPAPHRMSAPPARETTTDAIGEQLNEARLAAIVEMIKKLTGRDVKLVPPSPYLVSGPVRAEPVTVEVAANDIGRDAGDDHDEPVEVDITEVLERGTSARMRLSDGEQGTLVLRPDLDVTL